MISAFLDRAWEFPDAPALAFTGHDVTYAQLASEADLIARGLGSAPGVTAILAGRSIAAYAGVLAARMAQHTFVPLNPTFPVNVLDRMQHVAGAGTVVAGPEAMGVLRELTGRCRGITRVILPEARDVQEEVDEFRRRGGTVLTRRELSEMAAVRPLSSGSEGPAYLMFTSGSTGAPKAVAVTESAASAWLDAMRARSNLQRWDRASHITTLDFDCALLEVLVPWSSGACVCVPDQAERLNLGTYIRNRRLTVWVSSPATVSLMRRMGILEPDSFPSLRLSVFGSEGLPVDLAIAWSRAAPNSVLENVYGPTELTVCCTAYRIEAAAVAACAENGIVPIGEPLPGMRALVVDAQLRPVAAGETGELLMTGPQLALGYWGEPDLTREAFVAPPSERDVFYRTRDLVRRPMPGCPMTFLGRLDDQFKINGVRVEPGEIEAVLRCATGCDTVVAVGWPVSGSSAEGVVAFVEASHIDERDVMQRIRRELPRHMLPRRIVPLAEVPRTARGKVNRRALLDLLGRDAQPHSPARCL